MPSPDDRKEETIRKIKASLSKKHPNWSEDKIASTAFKIYNAKVKTSDKAKKKEFLVEKEGDAEELRVFGFIRTTFPDLQGEITPKETLDRWASLINDYPDMGNESSKGDYHHDRNDQHLTSIGEYAEVLPIGGGNYGLWVSDFVNAMHPNYSTVKYEIENSMLPAYSVEFDGRGMQGNIITPDCTLWGYAHASRPVDTHAVKVDVKEMNYAQFQLVSKEVNMEEVKIEQPAPEIKEKEAAIVAEMPKAQEPKQEVIVKEQSNVVAEVKAEVPNTADLVKKEVEIQVLKLKEALKNEVPEAKVLIKTKESEEGETMEELPLKFKELKDSSEKKDFMKFKEVAYGIVTSPEVDIRLKEQFEGHGIPLRTTMKMKCVGNKIQITEGPQLKFKDTLNTQSNAGAYTESPVEFADVFQPGIIDTFNNADGLLGQMKKVDHVPSDGAYYNFRIKTGRNTSAEIVSPDNVTVTTGYMDKLKLRQEIKVRRIGVSVADYTMYHSARAIGDLFQVEVDSAMVDLMDGIKGDLFCEQVGTDGAQTLLGLEAVADSAGNTTLYGKTRSAANRLAPDTATDTYNAEGGALDNSGDEFRDMYTQLITEGSRKEDIKFVMSPLVYKRILNLLDGTIYYQSQQNTAAPALGFNAFAGPSFDGFPIIVDHKCTSTAGSPIYCIDMSSWIMVVSKAPQLTGLAKVSAGTSAYIETYYTTVYLNPRRIAMTDTVTS